jgi:heme-degrading monooxygenase HmoA
MIAVIFESRRSLGGDRTFRCSAHPLARRARGLHRGGGFQSVSEPGKFVALSFWRDDAAIDKFHNTPQHRDIQAKSRAEIFDDYRLRAATVLRDYSKDERAQAPADSLGSAEASRLFAIGPKASLRRQ